MGCCCCTIICPALAGKKSTRVYVARNRACLLPRWRVRSCWLARRGRRRRSTAATKLSEDDDQSPSEGITEEARDDAAAGRQRGHLLLLAYRYHEICSFRRSGSSIHGMMGNRSGQTGRVFLSWRTVLHSTTPHDENSFRDCGWTPTVMFSCMSTRNRDCRGRISC
jgi:hypothetical protein